MDESTFVIDENGRATLVKDTKFPLGVPTRVQEPAPAQKNYVKRAPDAPTAGFSVDSKGRLTFDPFQSMRPPAPAEQENFKFKMGDKVVRKKGDANVARTVLEVMESTRVEGSVAVFYCIGWDWQDDVELAEKQWHPLTTRPTRDGTYLMRSTPVPGKTGWRGARDFRDGKWFTHYANTTLTPTPDFEWQDE